jgi:hypothetical protein
LKERPRSCKALGATPPGALARSHGIAQQLGGKNVPSASISLCGFLTDTTAGFRGTLEDSHKGPLITGKKPLSSQNNKNANELTNCKLHLMQSRFGDRSPRPRQPQRPSKRPASAPLGRNSAPLEGYTHPRAGLRLARGSHGSAAPAPTPLTGALNALTRHGRPGQGRIPTTPAL